MRREIYKPNREQNHANINRMMRANSTDSDITSYATSSPLSPKNPNYYVLPQTLGRLWIVGFRDRLGIRQRLVKGIGRGPLHEEHDEYLEHAYDDDESQSLHHRVSFIFVVLFVAMFSLIALILWGASRRYEPEIDVKSLSVSSFYFGTEVDNMGVSTKLMTVNCSLKLDIYNHDTFFGIHVSSTGFNFMLSKIIVATGQFSKYYQPRKSKKTLYVILEGIKVPLYGAGRNLVVSESIGNIPLKLEFEIQSRGNVLGMHPKFRNHKHISCPVLIDADNIKVIHFKDDFCIFD
ncbi:hypothetical protein GIB67_016988 [Kingdonia uniflora]|uniref:Late embryogenesis abundant protein LEA-2 subgroup domain-containing protein n=1 Tax=Kingdonia uniflora TaxID=39325 RepID=A0A7J7M3P9_9MAGN|nr:hypothetical protein GIB67_016988 [Kingdonia uniflora]